MNKKKFVEVSGWNYTVVKQYIMKLVDSQYIFI